jgi:rod shape-determining protein MreD
MPNLTLVAAIVAGYTLGSESGGFAGICLGLYQDAQSGKILGMYALFYLYTGVIAGFFPKKTYIGDFSTALIAVYTLTLLNECAIFLFAYTIPILRSGLTPGTDFIRAAGAVIVPAAFINALWSIPYYFVLKPGTQQHG